MRYVVNLYGTVWIRNDNGNKIVVTGDLSHMKGYLGRTIFIREGHPHAPLGAYEDKLTTPLKLVKNSTPVNSQARAAKMAISPEETTSNTSPIPLRDTRTGMRYDIDFRESVWRRTETGKVVQVTADPAAAMGNPRRKLLVVVIQGDNPGCEHYSSPERLRTAYEPVSVSAARIANGARIA